MTITPMMQYIQDKVYTIVCNNWIPISQEISLRDIKYYYPISLPRLLTALEKNISISLNYYAWVIISWKGERINRKLLNEDKSDASLFDQSPETITAIWVLLWWKDEKTL